VYPDLKHVAAAQPAGTVAAEEIDPGVPDSAEHGVVMLVVCASLFRQFEFVQRFEVTTTEAKVETKAGGFTNCVVVRNEQPLPKNQGKLVTEWTYAPRVGLVQVLTQTVGPSGTRDQVRLELVAHHLR